jgi:hypothetical protein
MLLHVNAEATARALVKLLYDEFNVQVLKQIMERLTDGIQQLPGVEPLSTEQLDEHEDFFETLLREDPSLSAMNLLTAMQRDRGVTSKIWTIQRWLKSHALRGGARGVTCADISLMYWDRLFTDDLAMSDEMDPQRLLSDQKVWIRADHLHSFLATLRRTHVKTGGLREALRLHWKTAIDLHFGVASVSAYPRAPVPITSPVAVFKYRTLLLSWVVCDKCGRRDATPWKTPCLKNGQWSLPYPEIKDGITCASHALWQQKFPHDARGVETGRGFPE